MHKSAECTKTTARETSNKYANIASASVDMESDNSLMSAVAWSDDEDEDSPPRRKKARTQKRTLKKKKVKVQSSDDESSSDE